MGNNILLGISGGIAAYKACSLVRELTKRGDEVRAVMTAGAQEFIRPMTLQVLTDNPVGVTTFDAGYESEIGHIDLARWADAVMLAPATANLVARVAAGMGDDLLTTVLLATDAPVVVAPAMNTQMWHHPRVQANLETIASMPRHHLVDPDEGELACKEVGPGRLPDAEVLVQAVDAALTEPLLADKKVLVTAGPTREFIDPARFISNPSTGTMGHCIARAAREMGADVTLVRGPVELEPPYGVDVVDVTTARQMHQAVMQRAASVDVVVMAAAVADWRAADEQQEKMAKSEMADSLELERNPDILADLGEKFGPDSGQDGPVLVGFAAETQDVVNRAREKRKRKGAHLIVANQIGGSKSAFGDSRPAIHVLSETTVTDYPANSKLKQARAICREVAAQTCSPGG